MNFNVEELGVDDEGFVVRDCGVVSHSLRLKLDTAPLLIPKGDFGNVFRVGFRNVVGDSGATTTTTNLCDPNSLKVCVSFSTVSAATASTVSSAPIKSKLEKLFDEHIASTTNNVAVVQCVLKCGGAMLREKVGFEKTLCPETTCRLMIKAELDVCTKLLGLVETRGIVDILGIVNNLDLQKTGILMEAGDCDAHQLFFPTTVFGGGKKNTKPYTLDSKIFVDEPTASLERVEHIVRLKALKFCIDGALGFLRDIGVVYGDWKPDNFIAFLGKKVIFKLSDFGSVTKVNVSIPNPKVVNQIFGAPNFSPAIETLKPKYEDDYKAVSYLWCTLNGVELPWLNTIIQHAETVDEFLVDGATTMVYWQKVFSTLWHINPSQQWFVSPGAWFDSMRINY